MLMLRGRIVFIDTIFNRTFNDAQPTLVEFMLIDVIDIELLVTFIICACILRLFIHFAAIEPRRLKRCEYSEKTSPSCTGALQ